MNTTLLLGATSAMAEHTARRLAADGDTLILGGRNPEKLEILKQDLLARGAGAVKVLPPFDAAAPDSLPPVLEALKSVDPDRVLVAFGDLPDPEDCEADPVAAARVLQVNAVSVMQLLTPLANRMEAQEDGVIAVISSVAGLRGRQSNYHYGAAKGALNVFLQGLRNRLQPVGVRVVTLLPGFVDSPMTAHLDQGPLFISAEKAGELIHKALTTSKADVVYIPGFWRWIMLIIRLIPEPVFKRLKL